MRRDVQNLRRLTLGVLASGLVVAGAVLGGCETAQPSGRVAGGPGGSAIGRTIRGSETVFAGDGVRMMVSDEQAGQLAEASRRDFALGYEPSGPLFDDGWIREAVPQIEQPRYVFLGSVRSNFFVFFRRQ